MTRNFTYVTTDTEEQRIFSETTSACIAEMNQYTDRNKMNFHVGKTETALYTLSATI
jgi:hypothetical protein